MPTKAEIETELEEAKAKLVELAAVIEQHETDAAASKAMIAENDGAAERVAELELEAETTAAHVETLEGAVTRLQTERGELAAKLEESKGDEALLERIDELEKRLAQVDADRKQVPKAADEMANEFARSMRACGHPVSRDMQHHYSAAFRRLMSP